MTLIAFLILLAAAFVVGVIMHIALYPPTATLPPMWRNLTRYTLGVGAGLVLSAVAILLSSEMQVWRLLMIQAVLFAMTGLGVGLGYLIMDD